MTRYLVTRLIRALVTLWVVMTLVFIGMRMVGDPFEGLLENGARPEDVDRIREAYGLDRPIVVQYAKYLGAVVGGDFGQSIRGNRPAEDVVFQPLPATLKLAALSLLVAIAIGLPAGVVAAVYRGSAIDRVVISLSFVGQAVPGFVIAILLIFCFTLWLGWLPSFGDTSWKHVILPVASLASASLSTIARITRVAVLEVLHADYVRTARAKGVRERSVLIGHVVRNAAVPVLTMVGMLIGGAISGSIVVETVFAWPGMGQMIQRAVSDRDYPVIQLVVIVVAAVIVAANLCVDIAYGVIDPRIRLDRASSS